VKKLTRRILSKRGFPYVTECFLVPLNLTGLVKVQSNALAASRQLPGISPVTLRLNATRERLVIEVWDYSPEDPRPTVTGADAENGRGLLVVEALSSRWGHLRTSTTARVVWAELTR
jgi:hypothetical protein